MTDGDTQYPDTIQTDLLGNKGLKGLCQSESTQANFNSHLSQAGNTQEDVVVDIFNQRSRCWAEAFIPANKPQKTVRV